MKFHCVLLNGVEVTSFDQTTTEVKTLGVWREDLLTMRTEAEIEAATEAEILELAKEFLSNLWYVGAVEDATIDPTETIL